jgi:hypothetical protein
MEQQKSSSKKRRRMPLLRLKIPNSVTDTAEADGSIRRLHRSGSGADGGNGPHFCSSQPEADGEADRPAKRPAFARIQPCGDVASA